jgi:hypothetical protein
MNESSSRTTFENAGLFRGLTGLRTIRQETAIDLNRRYRGNGG